MCRERRRGRRRIGLFTKGTSQQWKCALRISGIKKRKRPFPFLMPATGIEPVLCHHNRILSPARLPVPPRGQASFYGYIKKFSLYNHNENGQRWIRTTEAICSRFTVCPLWPLGNLPIYQSLIVLTNIDYSITPCCVQGVLCIFCIFYSSGFFPFRMTAACFGNVISNLPLSMS